jgi:O-antigen ligase
MVALLVLPCAIGSYAAYVAIIAIGLALVVGFDWPSLLAASRQTWVGMLACAFALLAVAFVVGAQTQTDALYALDFIPLLLAAPAVAMLQRMRLSNGTVYLARLSLLGSLAAVLAGLNDVLIHDLARARGLENSPIHYAAYALILGFFALTGITTDRSRWRWLYVLGPVLGLLAVMLSGTRAALLVGAVLAIVFGLVFWRRWIGRWRVAVVALIVGLVVVAAALVLANITGFVRPFEAVSVMIDLLSGKPVTDYSTALRLDFYSSGYRAFLDAPWFGHGWHNQIKSAAPYFSATTQAAYLKEGWGFIHNEPLGFAISGGIVGFVAYWLLMLAPVTAYFSTPARYRTTGQLSLALTLVFGFLLAGMTDVLFMWELPKTMFVVIAAAIAVLPRAREA